MERYLDGPLRDLVQYNNNFLAGYQLNSWALNTSDALEYFSKAVEVDPTCPRPWVNLGVAQIVKGEDKEAINSLLKVHHFRLILMELRQST